MKLINSGQVFICRSEISPRGNPQAGPKPIVSVMDQDEMGKKYGLAFNLLTWAFVFALLWLTNQFSLETMSALYFKYTANQVFIDLVSLHLRYCILDISEWLILFS